MAVISEKTKSITLTDVKNMSLQGAWTVEDANKEYAFEIDLPSDLISTMAQQKLIPDPYWGRNEYEVRWIADRDWTVRRTFEVMDTSQVLVLSRLDCVATVSVNGTPVLRAQNAFRRYRVDLSDVLFRGVNSIEITFHSPTEAANQAQAKQPFFVPHTKNFPVPNGNMLRKPQCDFGWDWNLALVPSGIYGDLHLEPVVQTRIDDVLVYQTHQTGFVQVRVVAQIEGKPLPGRAELCGQVVEGEINGHQVEFAFEIADPELWWPAGQGAQPLHHLKITIGGATETRRIGLRDLRLISEPDDVGRSFKFQVNGRDVFAKGANWIPQDALAGNTSDAGLRDLLTSARDSNMNMIRVWGGGWYESEAFYDICDELGLMVWQDAMFACSLYPADDGFLNEVAQEVVDNGRRLHHRACLALWCGDNEMIGALTWYKESLQDRDRYLVAYDRLNRTIETALKSVDPEVNWWPSSPSPGPLSFGDAWHDDSSGDMHFWSVWHEGRDFEHYRDVQPRFCSEFGFQSYPSMPAIKRFADPKDFNIAAPVMESHQKNTGGNARIAETMFRYFRFPVDFESFVYLSQVQQGLAIQTAVTYWRSLKPHCMGALIWQLNDTWPVCSWASLDHGGGWKLLHHMARRFFAPVHVTAVPETGGFEMRAVNDTAKDVQTSLLIEAITPRGARRVVDRSEAHVSPDQAQILSTVTGLSEDEILVYHWETACGHSGRDWFAPHPYKSYDLIDPGLEFAVTQNGLVFEITITSTAPAFFVSLEADCLGRYSDNAFLVLPGNPVTVEFSPDGRDQNPAFRLNDLYSATCT